MYVSIEISVVASATNPDYCHFTRSRHIYVEHTHYTHTLSPLSHLEINRCDVASSLGSQRLSYVPLVCNACKTNERIGWLHFA